jgi:hypothetical protein
MSQQSFLGLLEYPRTTFGVTSIAWSTSCTSEDNGLSALIRQAKVQGLAQRS